MAVLRFAATPAPRPAVRVWPVTSGLYPGAESFRSTTVAPSSPGPWSNRTGGADATFARQPFLSAHLLAQTLPPIKLPELESAIVRTLAPAPVTNK